MTSPDYSAYARAYAEARPSYPAELFAYLSSLVSRHECAWDCATGSGQAAIQLVKHFDHVVATDMSAEQIRYAIQHPEVEYRVALAEQSGLEDASVDLVTVASALHWFDLDRFYGEARRVLRPNGVLAAWTYHVGHMEPPFDDLFLHFYLDVIYPHFPPGARLVDNAYRDITLPGTPLDPPNLFVSASWNLHHLLAFMYSWSGTQEYMREHGSDPVDLISDELHDIWGEADRTRTVRWPLYVRVTRL